MHRRTGHEGSAVRFLLDWDRPADCKARREAEPPRGNDRARLRHRLAVAEQAGHLTAAQPAGAAAASIDGPLPCWICRSKILRI